MTILKTAVIGGGINGVMTAWALARRGAAVTLYDRGELMGATSSASTKLLHGGLRYLETGALGLVRESLRERAWWIQRAPHLAHPLRILIPIYRHARRGRWKFRLGLALYDRLAGEGRLGLTSWLSADAARDCLPTLKTPGLLGAYAFYDGQMDDRALGLWAAAQAHDAGVDLQTRVAVDRVSVDGMVELHGGVRTRFDRIINVAGPWAHQLLAASEVTSSYELDLIRGSHLLVDRQIQHGALLEFPQSARIGFVLPYGNRTLIGTTEVRQTLQEDIACSEEERRTLTDLFNTYFDPPLSRTDNITAFAGVRPLIKSHADPTRATREYALERTGALVCVFGGKWTTSRILGEKAAELALR